MLQDSCVLGFLKWRTARVWRWRTIRSGFRLLGRSLRYQRGSPAPVGIPVATSIVTQSGAVACVTGVRDLHLGMSVGHGTCQDAGATGAPQQGKRRSRKSKRPAAAADGFDVPDSTAISTTTSPPHARPTHGPLATAYVQSPAVAGEAVAAPERKRRHVDGHRYEKSGFIARFAKKRGLLPNPPIGMLPAMA